MRLSELQQEFLDDHRVLIAGLNEIIRSLEAGDQESAVARARDLDHEAGPHMAFEEEIFYPTLAAVHGQEFVERMVAEHEAGHRAIKALLTREVARPLEGAELQAVLDDLQIAQKHVLGCGSMLSELGTGELEADAESLARLRELRTRHERWTERPYSAD